MTRDDAAVVIAPTPMSWRTDWLFGVVATAVAVAGAIFDVFPRWLIVTQGIIAGAWLALAAVNASSYGEEDNR